MAVQRYDTFRVAENQLADCVQILRDNPEPFDAHDRDEVNAARNIARLCEQYLKHFHECQQRIGE